MKKTLMTLAAVAGLFALTANAANTWYVDDDNYNESYANAAAYTAAGYDGKSMANAFGTIQIAIDKASSGDTIYVAPGVYSNGLGKCVASWGKSRIGWNNKKLCIYSTGDASNTHIVGEKTTETAVGTGTNAVRCLSIYDNSGTSCDGTIFKGFTFRDGSTVTLKSEGESLQDQSLQGGAVRVSNQGVYFVDCVFTRCSAVNAGAVCNGTYVRCLFQDNLCERSDSKTIIRGGSTTSPGRVRLYACVVHHNQWGGDHANSGGGILIHLAQVFNSTIIDNSFASCCYSANEHFYNTVFFGSGSRSSQCTYSNCVSTASVGVGDRVEPRSVMSTIHPDIRLLPGSVARTAGDGSHLALLQLPEGIDYSDYGGNMVNTSGTIAAGATQTVGTPAAGGIAVWGGATCVDGRSQCKNEAYSYVFPDVYPTQYVFTAFSVPEGKRPAYFFFSKNYGSQYDYRFPDRNDRLLVTPPANPDVVITNTSSSPAILPITYVDPTADASLADGTAEHPYRTLQAAYDAKYNTVIVAKAGIYEEGYTNVTDYGRSRLHTTHVTRITSEEGAERTIIRGAADTSGEADEYGCGPNAIRCISHTANMTQLQGFTLTGGRTANATGNAGRGGAVCSNCEYLDVDDCIITNNCAYENAAVNGGRMSRCYVAGNSGRNFVVSGGRYRSCVFEDNYTSHPDDGLFGNDTRLVHCTVVAASGQNPYFTGNSIRRYATVFLGGNLARSNGVSAGNVCWDLATVDDTAALVQDPLLADPANGDWHPFASSPVFTAGVAPEYANYGNDYWFYVTSDYEGNPMVFDGGKPVAGAFMKPTTKRIVAVSAENGGLSPSASRVELGTEESYTLTIGNGTRPVAGVVANGITNLATEASWSVTISGADAVGGIAVSALYTNVWYAAPNGSDLASGFFPDAAKTLQGALSNANIRAYDRVVALPGTYRTGKMIQSGNYAVYSRAVVPANVTLESRDGRDATVIEGAQATVKDDPPGKYDVKGLGADAIRCVLLQSGSLVKGFTLTNGWTRALKNNSTVEHGDADTCGGGVWSTGLGGTVEDCVVTGGGAYRGAGVFGSFCRNCVFANNFAYYGGGGSSNCRNHGCLSYGNSAAVWSVNDGIFYIYDAINCTCFDSLSQSFTGNNFLGVSNTVSTGYFYPSAMLPEKVSHCIFNKDKLSSVPAEFFAGTDGSFATNTEVLVFENYRPVIGKNICVDAATEDVPATLADRDVFGGQRVYNGRLDIGAAEADWRNRFGGDISSRATVLAAAPSVSEQSGGTVRVPEGASLDGYLRNTSGKARTMTLRFRVENGSTALLTLDGEERTLETGEHDIRVVLNANDMTFSLTAVSGTVDILHAQNNNFVMSFQ